jgi:disulfide bond formation protein DsbB
MLNPVNNLLAILTVASQLFIIVGILHFCFFRKNLKSKFTRFFYQNGLILAFLVALVATLGSLFYSDVAGFEPCKLCWFQRIFMYPLAVLLGSALIKRDDRFTIYPTVLAIIGATISLYHNYIYYGGISVFPCPPFGAETSCTRVLVMEFGYITIPLMALTAFVLIILLLAAQRQFNLSKTEQ